MLLCREGHWTTSQKVLEPTMSAVTWRAAVSSMLPLHSCVCFPSESTESTMKDRLSQLWGVGGAFGDTAASDLGRRDVYLSLLRKSYTVGCPTPICDHSTSEGSYSVKPGSFWMLLGFRSSLSQSHLPQPCLRQATAGP